MWGLEINQLCLMLSLANNITELAAKNNHEEQ